MKRAIQHRIIYLWPIAILGIITLLLAVRHYYEAITSGSLRAGSQSVVLTRNLVDFQAMIHRRLTAMYTGNTIVDGLVLLLTTGLLYFFYRTIRRQENLTRQVIEHKKELTRYLDTIPAGVVVLNADRQIVFMNSAGQQLIDLPPSTKPVMLSDWVTQLRLAPASTDQPQEPIELSLNRALRGEAVFVGDLVVETSTGKRATAMHARPLYNEEGDYLSGAIATFYDCSEANGQKTTELTQAHIITERAPTEREISLGNIGYDSRKAVDALVEFRELLYQQKTGFDVYTYVDKICTSGNNLLVQINELLDKPGLKSGLLRLEPAPAALADILQSVAADLPLVTLMNETVRVQSIPGQGTTFMVHIPFDLAVTGTPVPPQPIPAAVSHDQSTSIKVLVVEDDVMNQRVLEGYLQGHRVKTVIANNGLEAIEILRNESFALIFMDVQMPEMDGYTATETIRQQLVLHTPIIAMTACTTASEYERCLAVGMNDYLAKPIRMHQLNNVLARFVPTLTLESRNNTMNTTDNIGAHIIHVSYLDELIDGDNELLGELVELFRRDLDSYRQTLFGAAERNDNELFRQTSHKFRSSINSLAMLDVAKKLKQMESDYPVDNLAVIDQLSIVFQEINEGLLFLKKRLTTSGYT
ncbi:response regulator [Spirosoma utsteinense]|uniref:CheY-like chemotaxis protein/PAS domain-containing protein n=1 Tax=Spirosoma utsteinense TaxID=2585773 RepID=A0ABR6W5T1_9BACT|nr:response regulator [Spirosoma utsteinense]MBC3788009.1 CheY-like chemotaxis protein/PAS domain-containing protein [Spirosoma utsteinense]MBC3791292.1 CheY-like chemotaxis protein/PAS domain-containing protein [Spirosoma utsteinense]